MYPTDYPACIMCGAGYGQHCTYISTHDGVTAGDQRPVAHAARAQPGEEGPGEGFVPVKDEGNWSDQ